MAVSTIRILDEHIANKIAAGEVIERPASVVKELVENALDAEATRIEVEIKAGGKEYIRVTDNGNGIPSDQLAIAFERHATSKIAAADDLFNVGTLGFRGEALPSIAAVAEVDVRSRTAAAPTGFSLAIKAGEAGPLTPTGSPVGTTFVVRQLFFNTPARYKFLRTDAAERRRVADVVARIALAWPNVALRFVADGRELFSTPGDGQLPSAIGAIYGHDLAADLVPVLLEQDGLHVDGYVSKPDKVHGNRDRMSVFLNRRWIQSPSLLHAVQRGYETLLPPRRFPLAVLRLTTDTRAVDVNVHPAKAEVRFQDDGAVYRTVMRAVRYGLLDANLIGGWDDGGIAVARESPSETATARQSETPVGTAPSLNYDSTDGGRTRSDFPTGPQETVQTRFSAATGATKPPVHRAVSASVWDPGTYDAPRAQQSAAAARPERSTDSATNDRGARNELREMNIIGQLQRTFILGETRKGLWIVDQHVAHERILYELFLEETAEADGIQQLLVPVPVTLTPDRLGLVEQFSENLARLGFILEPFGGSSYVVRGVPVAFRGTPDAEQLTSLLEEMLDACVTDGKWDAHEAAASLSCRAAIKAGQRLNEAQMRDLVLQLADADNPFACPHGRPIVIEVGRPDLERRFGRR